MPSSTKLWLSTTAAFAGGFLSGLMVAPTSGRELRRRLAESTHSQRTWVEHRLQQVESQLSVLETQLQTTSAAFSERFRDVTGRALEAYVPSMRETAWNVEKGELARELRFMPRG